VFFKDLEYNRTFRYAYHANSLSPTLGKQSNEQSTKKETNKSAAAFHSYKVELLTLNKFCTTLNVAFGENSHN